MKTKKIKLISLSLLLVTGLLSGFLIPKNTPILAHFLNKNSIDIEVENDLNEEMVKIEFSILGTDFEDITIVENESINPIPKGYGENDWFLSYDEKKYGVFRHFKTNNWHDHHYSFSFYKNKGEVLCDVQIDGPDQMNKRTIKLDKKNKNGRRF
ncbi:hypothetical protein [Flavicella sediminum]|uniref:hypothetical protein n=1 Tax=Flavicella sediminum TaxID=2585141 RepID=UPI001123C823|nr:hypothetical protein [Flavicella sediminum]